MSHLRMIGAALAAALVASPPASALQIDVTASQISGNLWSYEYKLSDRVFSVDQGFTLWFDKTLFENLQVSGPNSSYWDPLVFQPDNPTGEDGMVDSLALQEIDLGSNPELGIFRVDFGWLGSGTPIGLRQEYEIYSCNSGDCSPSGWNSITTGYTNVIQGSVPVPAPLALLAAGLVSFGLTRSMRGLITTNQAVHSQRTAHA